MLGIPSAPSTLSVSATGMFAMATKSLLLTPAIVASGCKSFAKTGAAVKQMRFKAAFKHTEISLLLKCKQTAFRCLLDSIALAQQQTHAQNAAGSSCILTRVVDLVLCHDRGNPSNSCGRPGVAAKQRRAPPSVQHCTYDRLGSHADHT